MIVERRIFQSTSLALFFFFFLLCLRVHRNHRRRAGIPDSDTRPFRVAFLDAEAKRREKESNQREQVMKQKDSSRRLLQPSATAPNLQSPSILQRESSMRNRNLGASPRAQSQLVDSSISPAGSSSVYPKPSLLTYVLTSYLDCRRVSISPALKRLCTKPISVCPQVKWPPKPNQLRRQRG